MFLEYQRILDHDKVMVKCPMSVVEKLLKEGISNLPQHPKFRKLYPCDMGPDNYAIVILIRMMRLLMTSAGSIY